MRISLFVALTLTSFSWPLYLDNSVAGGIPHGMTPFEAIVKECNEEANLDEDFVRAHAKSCGAVTYYFKCVIFFIADICRINSWIQL